MTQTERTQMNVLSLFDGMSCGRIALERAGIKVDNYYSSEIDKYAIQVADKNYPQDADKRLGSVIDLDADYLKTLDIDMIIGGSPCQGFSVSGSLKGSATKCGKDVTTLEQYLMLKEEGFEFDGQSYLFWEYVRVWKAIQPKYFFLENVRVTKKWLPMFNEAMGVEPIMINSSLMSAQNRVRFYWTNIPGLEQPQDKGILLRDVLETDIDTSKYKVKPSVFKNIERDHNEIIKSNKDFFTMKTTSGFQDNKVGLRKTPCLRAGNSATYILQVKEATKKGYTEIQDGDCFDYSVPNSKTRRGRNMKDKSNCLQTSNGFMRYEHPTYRKLTPLECERLQTVPDNYTEGVSNSQRYKMLGNGWTVDVIAHIFKGIRDGRMIDE